MADGTTRAASDVDVRIEEVPEAEPEATPEANPGGKEDNGDREASTAGVTLWRTGP
jgi:hypothetical protein